MGSGNEQEMKKREIQMDNKHMKIYSTSATVSEEM